MSGYLQKTKDYIKQWGLVGIIVIAGGFLLVTGIVFSLLPSIQVITKKLFLVGLWYGLSYAIRRFRIGHINWDDEKDKKIYYFVFIACTAVIIAFA